MNVKLINDLRLPVSGASVIIDNNHIGQTNSQGEITALLSGSGNIRIQASKSPLGEIDTLINLEEAGAKAVFTMLRPYASLAIFTTDESGKALGDVEVTLDKRAFGKTDETGILSILDTLHLNDSIYVKLEKDGFESTGEFVYLSDESQADSFVMEIKKAVVPSKPKPKPKPEPDFQTHYNLASRYLDRAISGEAVYYGKALSEIDKAIDLQPKYMQAKQLKVEILYNFAKSLQNSKLLHEAANRCGEALKVYRDIPQDQMYNDIVKLKSEIDAKLK